MSTVDLTIIWPDADSAAAGILGTPFGRRSDVPQRSEGVRRVPSTPGAGSRALSK